MSLSKQHPHQEERSQLPQEYEALNDRFLALAQESADVHWILTPACEMREVSSSWYTFTGQEERDGLGRGWLVAVHPADQSQIEETVLQALTSAHTREMECHVRRYDGGYRLVRVRAIPVRTTDGTLREVVVCGTDITRRELSGQMSETQMQFAVKAARIGMWDWDLVTTQLIWTDQEKALFGYPPDTSVTHERFLAALHPDDRAHVNQIIAAILDKLGEYHAEYRVIWPDGSVHWLADRAQSISDAHGKQVHLVGVTIDIMDLKQAEEALLQSRDAFRLLAEALPQLVWIAQPDGYQEYANQQWYDYTGSTLELTQGEGWASYYHPNERQRVQALWYASLLTGQPFDVEARILQKKTGAYRWFLVRAIPLRHTDGNVWKWFGTCTDIHEKKCTEEALSVNDVRFRRLMESNFIGVTVIDLEGPIREANDAFLELVGYTREDLVAGRLNWKAMTPPEHQASSAQAVKELRATGVAQPYEKEYVRKDGKRVPVLMGGTLLRWEEDASLAISFVVDQTARRESDRQKDLMLGMTSHELKTPLAALRGTLQLVQRRLKRVVPPVGHVSPEMNTFFESLTKSLADSVRQIDVQTRLINDLLDVSRITAQTLELELDHCNLGDIVRETIEDLRVTAPKRSLLLELPEHTEVPVLADWNRISQVVTNYVTNALRYSSPDQPVSIGLTLQENTARVWVRDQGPGFTEEAKTQLWQRYHPVKGVPVQSGSGKGLGLGLYICQMLIAQHQGEVGVESTPGEGSTFWFALPLVSTRA